MRKQVKLSTSSAAVLEGLVPSWKASVGAPVANSAISAPAPDVAAMLLAYFRTRLGMGSLTFTEKPVAFTDGFETYTYHFQLQSPLPLSPNFTQPLAVRIYCGPVALPRARQEFRVQRHLYQLSYPVAEPLFLEENCTYLDGPFLVMARICGPTLLQELLCKPWRLLGDPVKMAEVHARLHQLPTSGFPAPSGCWLARRLHEFATAIEEYDLRALRPGLDYLFANRPEPPKHPRILHLDFHPLNLVLDENHSMIVLDWSEAALGDPHADVGTTVMLMDCPPPVHASCLDRVAILAGRALFIPLYLSAYRRHLPLEEKTLSYYRALAAFRRLCNYGRWLQDGPQISGNKPAMLKCISDSHLQALERYFQKWTGVGIS